MPVRKSENQNKTASKKLHKKKRKTLRKRLENKCTKEHIIHKLMEMLNIIQLYHWNTISYPEHKATDELYARLSANVDKFVEACLGKKGDRIVNWNKQLNTPNFDKSSDFKSRMYEYRTFLINLGKCFKKNQDSDLLNIRDEILADLNQFLYLLTLK